MTLGILEFSFPVDGNPTRLSNCQPEIIIKRNISGIFVVRRASCCGSFTPFLLFCWGDWIEAPHFKSSGGQPQCCQGRRDRRKAWAFFPIISGGLSSETFIKVIRASKLKPWGCLSSLVQGFLRTRPSQGLSEKMI